MTAISKVDGKRPKWLETMQDMVCFVCGNDQDIVGHHVGKKNPRIDQEVLPLCQECHRALHQDFDHEAEFWLEKEKATARHFIMKGIKAIARQLYEDHNAK